MNKNQNKTYPIIETNCVVINVLFLPILFDRYATTGITKNVVTSAPILPCRIGHTPASPSLPENIYCTITKNVRLATVLKVPNIKKVDTHIFLNGLILNSSIAVVNISDSLPRMLLKVTGLKSDLSRVDLLLTKTAGYIAIRVKIPATQIAKSLQASCGDENNSGLKIKYQNQGAITQAH